jgi:S1-C subfamily serine protease
MPTGFLGPSAIHHTAQQLQLTGLIGLEVWRRFRMIYDLPGSQIILEPNEHLDEPSEYDMSGLALEATLPDLHGIRVRHVYPDSPASDSGLLEGDLIMSINGDSAGPYPLARYRELLLQEGREYTLTVIRGVQTLRVRIKTRRRI